MCRTDEEPDSRTRGGECHRQGNGPHGEPEAKGAGRAVDRKPRPAQDRGNQVWHTTGPRTRRTDKELQKRMPTTAPHRKLEWGIRSTSRSCRIVDSGSALDKCWRRNCWQRGSFPLCASGHPCLDHPPRRTGCCRRSTLVQAVVFGSQARVAPVALGGRSVCRFAPHCCPRGPGCRLKNRVLPTERLVCSIPGEVSSTLSTGAEAKRRDGVYPIADCCSGVAGCQPGNQDCLLPLRSCLASEKDVRVAGRLC